MALVALLPPELVGLVACYLDWSGFALFDRTCTDVHDVCRQDDVWAVRLSGVHESELVAFFDPPARDLRSWASRSFDLPAYVRCRGYMVRRPLLVKHALDQSTWDDLEENVRSHERSPAMV